MAKNVSHPYFPRDLVLPTTYVANDKTVVEILAVFFGVIGLAMVGTWVFIGASGKSHLKNISYLAKCKLCWFMMCGLIHTFLEGYFTVYWKVIAGDQSFLSQVWKEYSKGDSRYVSGDTFTVCMEGITGFIDGPLSFLALYAFVANTPYRHVVQLVLSLCQLYGDVLYFLTEYKEGFVHGIMWHPQYFWFYFVFMNAIWIVIPLMCVYESVSAMVRAQTLQDKQEGQTGKKKKN